VLRLTIPVPESAVPQVHLGEPVGITVPALRKTFLGKVSRFADKLDEQTRTMHTEVDVKNPDLVLVPGMYASAALTLAAKSGVVTVPVEAIDRNGGEASVVVVDANHKVEARPIELGIETPDRVEVVSGLQEGDLVVLGNRAQFKPGSSVVPKLK
jgi:RND family efflux transporter MFP subunit